MPKISTYIPRPPAPDGYENALTYIEVAGIQHRKQDALKFIRGKKHAIELRHEFDNPVDRNAIAVYGLNGRKRRHIGYVPADDARRLAEAGLSKLVVGQLRRIYANDNDFAAVNIDVLRPKQMTMKKEQLQEWMHEHDMADEWWVSVNGIVGDVPVSLRDALANQGDIQLCHVSRTDENDWWRIGTTPRPPAPPPSVATAVAEPAQEIATAQRKQHVTQSGGGLVCFVVGLGVLFLAGPVGWVIGPLLMLGLFAQKRTYSCTACGNALAKTSGFCPACRAKITGTKTRIMDVIMIGVVIFLVVSVVAGLQ